MELRHHLATHQALGRGGVRVHRDVREREGEARGELEQREGEGDAEVGGEAHADERARVRDRRPDVEAARPEPRDRPPREHERDERPRRPGDEQGGELALGHAELVADRGQARQEGREHHPHGEEEREDAALGLGHARGVRLLVGAMRVAENIGIPWNFPRARTGARGLPSLADGEASRRDRIVSTLTVDSAGTLVGSQIPEVSRGHESPPHDGGRRREGGRLALDRLPHVLRRGPDFRRHQGARREGGQGPRLRRAEPARQVAPVRTKPHRRRRARLQARHRLPGPQRASRHGRRGDDARRPRSRRPPRSVADGRRGRALAPRDRADGRGDHHASEGRRRPGGRDRTKARHPDGRHGGPGPGGSGDRDDGRRGGDRRPNRAPRGARAHDASRPSRSPSTTRRRRRSSVRSAPAAAQWAPAHNRLAAFERAGVAPAVVVEARASMVEEGIAAGHLALSQVPAPPRSSASRTCSPRASSSPRSNSTSACRTT